MSELAPAELVPLVPPGVPLNVGSPDVVPPSVSVEPAPLDVPLDVPPDVPPEPASLDVPLEVPLEPASLEPASLEVIDPTSVDAGSALVGVLPSCPTDVDVAGPASTRSSDRQAPSATASVRREASRIGAAMAACGGFRGSADIPPYAGGV